MASALFEVTGGIIRVFGDDAEYGDPFDFAFSVVGSEGVGTIKGMMSDGAFRQSHIPAIAAVLAEHGFREVQWFRYRGGRRREIRVAIETSGAYRLLRADEAA